MLRTEKPSNRSVARRQVLNVVLTGGHVHDSEPAIELLKGVTLKGKTILADISTPASISNAILLSASFSELKITVTLPRASTNWLFALRISFYLLLLLFTFNLPTNPNNSRRLSKDYEIRTASAEAMIKLSHIHTLLKRL